MYSSSGLFLQLILMHFKNRWTSALLLLINMKCLSDRLLIRKEANFGQFFRRMVLTENLRGCKGWILAALIFTYQKTIIHTPLVHGSYKWIAGLAPMAIEKNQNPGSRFGATIYRALPIWPIWPNFEVNGLDWQCCLAGSSKMAPRIFIFLIVLGA